MVIAFRENQWIDYRTDFRQWSNLCRSYQTPFQLLKNSWDEADIPNGYSIVLLDERGTDNLSSFVHPKNCVYVFGRTGMNDMLETIPHNFSVRVDAPNSKSTFGVSICCAVLYDRLVKWPLQ